MAKKMWRLILTLALGMVVLTSFSALAAIPAECNGIDNGAGAFSETLRNYAEDMSNGNDACWFCPIFEKMVTAINAMAVGVYNELSDDFISLMGIGILFVILFKVGKMVVSLQEVDLMQFLNDLIKPLGRAIIAVAILGVISGTRIVGGEVGNGKQTIFNILTQPVFDMSVSLSSQVLKSSLGSIDHIWSPGANGQVSEGANAFTQAATQAMDQVDQQLAAEGEVVNKQEVITEKEKGVIIAWMKQVASSFMVGLATGATLMKIGIGNLLDFGMDGKFSMFVSGLVIWGVFMLIYLMFPFKLVDAFVRLSFVLTLMPLWIVLWVFDATRKYTVKAWEMFLSSCLLFVVIGVMIGLVIPLMANIFPGNNDDVEIIFACLRAGQARPVGERLVLGSGLFTNALAFGAMSFMLLSAAAPIANTFAEAGGAINVGDGMAAGITRAGKSMVVNPAIKAAKPVVAPAAAYVGKSFKSVGGAALGGVASLGGRAISAVKSRFGGGSGGGDGGSGPTPGPTPPPRPTPGPTPGPTSAPATPLRGERGADGTRGERGAQGLRGERGERGERGGQGERSAENTTARAEQGRFDERNRTRENPADTRTGNGESAQERNRYGETVADAQGRRAAENPALDRRGQNAGATADQRTQNAETVNMYENRNQPGHFASATERTTQLTRGQKEMAGALAKKEGSETLLLGLARDTSFIEQSLMMQPEEFKAAMAGHKWATPEREMMVKGASEMYDNRKSANYFADSAERMVNGVLRSQNMSTLTREGVGDMTRLLKSNMQDTGRSNLSEQLAQMADTVSAEKVEIKRLK